MGVGCTSGRAQKHENAQVTSVRSYGPTSREVGGERSHRTFRWLSQIHGTSQPGSSDGTESSSLKTFLKKYSFSSFIEVRWMNPRTVLSTSTPWKPYHRYISNSSRGPS